MKTITWTVEFNWDYDFDRYVEDTIKYIKENNLSLEKDLKKIEDVIGAYIHEDIVGEDDDLFYNFGGEEYDTITNEIIEEIKNNYSIQIPLDI